MKFVSIVVLAAAVATASAQSRSSFAPVSNMTGLTSTISGLTITTTATAAPTFMIGSSTYTVTEVFGVWALDDNNDFSATGANQSGYNYNQNYSGTGGIAGWKTNPNQGFINDTKSFTYSSLAGTPEAVGYHVRVSGQLPGGGNTLFVTPEAVPEPASMTALALGAVAMLRRRRK